MVKKLYKHEFLAWLRVMPLIYGIVLVIAGLHRFIQVFENSTAYYSVVSGSAAFVYAVGLLVCLAAPTVFGIVRFYRNLFTGEGYLTLTLPVRTSSHLWVKILTATVFSVLSILVAMLSVSVITAGEVFEEMWKAFMYLVRHIPKEYGKHLAGYSVEFVLLWLVGTLMMHTFYDTCICIGQCARKNRILAAVGVYFGVYVALQILSTIGLMALMALIESGRLEALFEYIDTHFLDLLHIFACGTALVSAVATGICWLISHFILRKKLNLE